MKDDGQAQARLRRALEELAGYVDKAPPVTPKGKPLIRGPGLDLRKPVPEPAQPAEDWVR